MRLRKRLDFRLIATTIYIVLAGIYIIVGLSPAEAKSYEISGQLIIPAIGLKTDVASLKLENGSLDTPETLVGSYSRYDSKIFLVGHSTTVFQNLKELTLGDIMAYNHETYRVTGLKVLPKEEIEMRSLYAAANKKTLVVMTCSGESLPGGDATHRLIITATKVGKE